MKCPCCNHILFSIEYEEIELDYCDSCHGIWLDTYELDILLNDHTLTAGFLTAGDPMTIKGEKKRLCPICDSPMNKLVTGGTKPVVHDECPKGHGTWFDSTELLTIIEQGSDMDPDAALLTWLRSLFPEPQSNRPDS
ncbi:MAG: hypothetical protein BWY09_00039 [Candidatus Hydrogenedentes bacterium ADurb.Bin179]|nr:MAG: hypothetical protein BWY09_00039 [Candidatus Hydrogenedentes bacterium ADurb.Bin179]